MKTNNPDYLTASSGSTHLQTDLTSIMETKTNQAEPKSKKGLGMTLTEAIGELEKGHKITCDEAPEGRYCYLKGDKLYNSQSGRWCSFEEFKNEIPKDDKNVWRIYEPKLKNATQQKRVELIETQKWELLAATATIDNQRKELEDNAEVIGYLKVDHAIKETKLNNEIADLTERNGNLTRITNDQTERIEFLEHSLKTVCDKLEKSEKQCGFLITDKSDFQDELKNYELAIGRIETENKKINELSSKAVESRERLASKFTNWFLFLVLTNIGSIAWGVYQLLTK